MEQVGLLDLVALVSAVGCGFIGGALGIFSIAVMKALAAQPPPHGIAAMQAINVVIINPWFLTPLLGTGVTSAVLIAASIVRWNDPAAAYWLAGGVLYLAGTFTVTMACNVPRNNALAAIDPASGEGAGVWARYLAEWLPWNHVRTVTALLAAALFAVSLRV